MTPRIRRERRGRTSPGFMLNRSEMKIQYKLFNQEAVEMGDLYLSPVGGFIIEHTRVDKVDNAGFSYRSASLTGRHNFSDRLDGILVKTTEKGIEFYVCQGVLDTLNELQ